MLQHKTRNSAYKLKGLGAQVQRPLCVAREDHQIPAVAVLGQAELDE